MGDKVGDGEYIFDVGDRESTSDVGDEVGEIISGTTEEEVPSSISVCVVFVLL